MSAVTSPLPSRRSSIEREDGVDGQGEADVRGVGELGRVDADDLAPRVEQRPAGVAGVDGRVGLDEVRSRMPPSSSAMVRSEAETMPVVTVGLPPRPRALPMATTSSPTRRASEEPSSAATRSLDALDPQHGHVVVGEGADQLGAHGRAVEEGHRDLVGALDDVGVGEDEPLGGVVDEAAAGPGPRRSSVLIETTLGWAMSRICWMSRLSPHAHAGAATGLGGGASVASSAAGRRRRWPGPGPAATRAATTAPTSPPTRADISRLPRSPAGGAGVGGRGRGPGPPPAGLR